MFFYLVFIIVLSLFFADYKIGGQKKPRIFIYGGILFFILVLSLRFDVGWDYVTYYKTLYPYPLEWYFEMVEPIYKLFAYTIISLKLPAYFLFIFYGVATSCLLFKSLLKYTDNVFIGLLVYLAFYFETSFGFMRQGLSLVIILYGYKYLVQRKTIKYLLICAIAICAHYSAVVCLLFPFIFKFCSSFKKTIVLIGGITVALVVAMMIVFNYIHLYEHYATGEVSIGGGSMIRIMNILIILSLIVLAKRKKVCDIYQRLLYLALVGCCFPFIFGGHIGGRVAWYFLIYLCIVIPNVLEFKPNRIFNRFCEVGLMAIFLLLIYISSGNQIKSPYTPYQTILTVDLNHPQFK